MKREKREGRILTGAAELFDVPPELLERMPHVETMGDREFYMENHRGIVSYSGEEIDIGAEGMVVRLFGRELELVAMTGEALRIRGKLHRVEWVV